MLSAAPQDQFINLELARFPPETPMGGGSTGGSSAQGGGSSGGGGVRKSSTLTYVPELFTLLPGMDAREEVDCFTESEEG